MKMINKVILIGRLGKDPEIKYFDNGDGTGTAKTWVSLATDEGTSKAGVKLTNWHNIVAWGKTAELLSEYAGKGRLLYIEGRISYREYIDNKDQKQKLTEILVSEFSLLDSPKEKEGKELAKVGSGSHYEEDPQADEIPF